MGRDHILADAGLGDHAPIADQHDVREAKTNLQLVDLDREGFGVAGVAVEYLDRQRTAIRGTEQAVNDLQLAFLAVAVIAALGQRAAAPLDIAGADVVEHQRAPFGCRRARAVSIAG